MNIDVAFDFTSDTPNYWNNFWYDGVLCGGGADPDAVSKTLQTYHQFLWSKLLPNGEQMNLSMGKGYDYLSWKNFRFGSDSILARIAIVNAGLISLRTVSRSTLGTVIPGIFEDISPNVLPIVGTLSLNK